MEADRGGRAPTHLHFFSAPVCLKLQGSSKRPSCRHRCDIPRDGIFSHANFFISSACLLHALASKNIVDQLVRS